MMKNIDLFSDLSATLAASLFEETEYPWEVLPRIKDFVLALGPRLDGSEYERVADQVWIHRSCKVYDTAVILGPTIIGAETEVRPSAFIRGSVLVGRNCVVGNSTELKNCILFDRVQVPHYNYVGDSIFGYRAHTGAGAICSNVKSDKTSVAVHGPEGELPTGLRKFGAILGDHVEVGCNSVLCPGTVIGQNSNVYPLSRVRGVIPAGHIYKAEGNVVEKR